MKKTSKIFIVFVIPFIVVSVLFGAEISNTKKIIENDTTVTNYLTDTVILKSNMQQIINFGYRNYQNKTVLNSVANFIKIKFSAISDSVWEQKFSVKGEEYKNIIASINTDKKERIIIGAHYDVCENQDGADDNASGVVGLIRLAELLKTKKLNYRIDFVAYTLEEPPFFGTEAMGSAIHAAYLFDNKIPVKGMICLEMIGYFTDKKNSQDYPFAPLKMFYGNVGDYITVVQQYGNGSFGNQIYKMMKEQNLLPTKSFKGPKWMQGVDFSDHRNYWKRNYSAVMITNTAFYRNKNYHQKSDNIRTIDFKKMSAVIHEVKYAVCKLK